MDSMTTGYTRHPRGYDLFFRYHPVSEPRAHLLLVHGLGEHGGCYPEVIARCNVLGLDVFAYDQYGHGLSDGKRGAILTPDQPDADLRWILGECRRRHRDDLPLIVFGHSMGGAVVANRLAHPPPWPDAVIFSSPALKLYLSSLWRWLARLMRAFAPEHTVFSPIGRKVSHVKAVNRKKATDPLCHRQINAALALFIEAAGRRARARAHTWPVPTLLLFAGDDKLVDPRGSRAFSAAAPSHLVRAQEFPGYYHEIFHETDPEPVYRAVAAWLDDLCPGK